MAKYVKILNVRVSEKQFEELRDYAERNNENITDAVRSLIVSCLDAQKALV